MFRLRTFTFGALFSSLLLVGACSNMSGSTAQSGPVALKAILSSAQEVPPIASAGNGSAAITYDQATKRLTWSLTWANLSGPATAAHFHGPAAPGANAGVAIPIGAAGMTSPVSGQAVLTDAQAADLLGGRMYVNIHTAAHGGGEIRGQVTR